MSGPQTCCICTTKFGFFKKQYECKGCHRTTCKECQSYKAELPGLGIEQVCKHCHDSVKEKTTSSGRVSPPANFKREMEKKEVFKREKETNQVDKDLENRLNVLKGTFENEDISVKDLEDRLRKLCGDEITEEEIEYRLSKLKGSRPPAIRVHSMRKRDLPSDGAHSSEDSEVKQIKRLIRQYTAEIELEGGIQGEDMDAEDFNFKNIPENPSSDDLIELAKLELKKDKEELEAGRLEDEAIEKRLAELQDPPTSQLDGNDYKGHLDSDMDEESSKLIQQILEEDRLEQSITGSGFSRPNPEQIPTLVEETSGKNIEHQPDPDELPWCYLCNGDAVVRCLTCEGDLFCSSCFKYAHKDSDMKGHKTVKFTKKPGQYDDL